MVQAFDPQLITYQIVALQCFFYVALGSNLGIFHVIFETPISLNHFFSARYYSFALSSGFSTSSCLVLAGISGAFLLSITVERSKRCVDFTATLYILHAITCLYWDGALPLQLEFWTAIIISSITCASLGEFLCSRTEMEDIPLYNNSGESQLRLLSKSTSTPSPSAQSNFSSSASGQKLNSRPHSPVGHLN